VAAAGRLAPRVKIPDEIEPLPDRELEPAKT
jgi:hypothetical protein